MLLAMVLALAASAGGAATCPPELFRIARNTNANEVVYLARQAPDGTLDTRDPIRAEWQMLAEDGRREELKPVERQLAYGFSVRPAGSGGGYVVILKARPDRPVTLSLRGGCPFASVTINGRPADLRRIFVQAKNGLGPIPTVAWAELEGIDPATGARIQERVFPK